MGETREVNCERSCLRRELMDEPRLEALEQYYRNRRGRAGVDDQTNSHHERDSNCQQSCPGSTEYGFRDVRLHNVYPNTGVALYQLHHRNYQSCL